MSLDLAYIRNTYGVPAVRGERVAYHEPFHGRVEAVIVGVRDGLLRVQKDNGATYSIHPKRERLEYLGASK